MNRERLVYKTIGEIVDEEIINAYGIVQGVRIMLMQTTRIHHRSHSFRRGVLQAIARLKHARQRLLKLPLEHSRDDFRTQNRTLANVEACLSEIDRQLGAYIMRFLPPTEQGFMKAQNAAELIRVALEYLEELKESRKLELKVVRNKLGAILFH